MTKRRLVNAREIAIVVQITLVLAGFAARGSGAEFIVEDGVPKAEIVVAEKPVPMVKLAAEELRNTLKKISGAELPIASTPSADYPVKIYVGKSAATEKLNVKGDDLKHGAYRIVSGKNWLALIGNDRPYQPTEMMKLAMDARHQQERDQF